MEPSRDQFEIRYETDLSALPKHLDVAIIATNADIRPRIVERMLAANDIDFLILEKVVAQSPAAIDDISDALSRSGTKAWVNCTRRMWTFYRELKARFDRGRVLHVDVSGTDWGLGCNAIHFLDLVSWFNGSLGLTLSGARLDRTLVPAKRPGFKEFTGALTGDWDIGTSIQIASWRTAAAPFLLELRGEDIIAIVREDDGIAWIAEREHEWRWTEQRFSQEFQSALTDRAVSQLLATGDCELTPFSESARLHAAMLSALFPILREMSEFTDARNCPIT